MSVFASKLLGFITNYVSCAVGPAAVENGTSRLDDPRLLRGDLLGGVTQKGGVIQGNGGDNAGCGCGKKRT